MTGGASEPTVGESGKAEGSENVVEVRNLVVRYGTRIAVNDVSFSIKKGSVFGLVGPNGAGKTSIVESVLGLRRPASASRIVVLGLDPMNEQRKLGHLVGAQLQESAFPSRARVGELCRLYESIYERPGAAAALLETYGLDDRRSSLISSLSGGLRQRLALVLAQIGDIQLVVLDELTTGLDPEQRRGVWDAIRQLVRRGVTVLLTSHYMDEVEALCDEVGVLMEGSFVARGSPEELTEKYGGGTTFSLSRTRLGAEAVEAVGMLELAPVSAGDSASLEVRGDFPSDYDRLVRVLNERGIPSSTVRVHGPTFEDAYLNLVSREGAGTA